MTEREKKIKKEVDVGKSKTKKLRYENILLQRKRKRDEMKLMTAKSIQSLKESIQIYKREIKIHLRNLCH
jgi:hypothetical protein